jgi:hypothetical protein
MPIVSFAVKPDGLYLGNDIGVLSAKVLPVTMTNRSKAAVIGTVLQVVVFHSIKAN